MAVRNFPTANSATWAFHFSWHQGAWTPADAWLWYGDYEEFVNERQGRAMNVTNFGTQDIKTRVYHVVADESPRFDIMEMLREARAETGAAARPHQEAWVL